MQGILITLIIAVLAVALYVPVHGRLVNITDQSYKILADNLAVSIYDAYESNNRQEVINAVRNVERQQGVKYVLVVDESGIVYYDSWTGDQSLEGKNFTSDYLTEKSKKGDTSVGKVLRGEASYYNYLSPFTTNKTSYSVRLGVDEQMIDGQFAQLTKIFLYLAIFGIILGALASYLLASRLSNPIIKLTESALAIRAGNLSAYPNINTNDELEQLSREFQNMVEKLKQFYFQEFSQKKQAIEAKKRLEEVNNRLQALDHQKSDFLNAASHQLRTPLSIIHWSLSMFVENAHKYRIAKDQMEMLTESLASTKRMVDLVNELLDISRIEQGRKELNWEKSNYGLVCKELVDALQPLAKNKNLELTFEQEGDIDDSYLDPKNFYQVINNFVDNSIKYTAEGSVKVTVEQKKDVVEIKVDDTGIGMTEEEKKNLFTQFSRGEDATHMFANGSGLGMFVAHAILKQHGGDVSVESEKGRGTTFTLSVPVYKKKPDSDDASKRGQKQESDKLLEDQLKQGASDGSR